MAESIFNLGLGQPKQNWTTTGVAATIPYTSNLLGDLNLEGGLAGSAIQPVTVSTADAVKAANTAGITDWESKYDELLNKSTQQRENTAGMNPAVAGALGFGQLGLGLAGFLDNKKTSKLQREALRDNIASTREYNANRRADRQAWTDYWNRSGTAQG